MTKRGLRTWQGGTTSAHFYKLYGLIIRSNQPIDHLLPADTVVGVDLELKFYDPDQLTTALPSEPTVYASRGIAANGEPFLQVWRRPIGSGDHLFLKYTDGCDHAIFIGNESGNRIDIYTTPALPFQDILTYLLGPVIGCVLRLNGTTCLHAGVVAVGEEAVAIIGPKGAGKSTLVAALAATGCPVLSDDLAPNAFHEKVFFVSPGYPKLRMWPNSIKEYGEFNLDTLPRVVSITEKRYIDLSLDDLAPRWRFQQTSLPLHAVYLLGGRSEMAIHQVELLSETQCFFALTQNVYADYLLDGKERSDDFDLLGKLAAMIPVFKVTRPENLASIPVLCDIIRTGGVVG